MKAMAKSSVNATPTLGEGAGGKEAPGTHKTMVPLCTIPHCPMHSVLPPASRTFPFLLPHACRKRLPRAHLRCHLPTSHGANRHSTAFCLIATCRLQYRKRKKEKNSGYAVLLVRVHRGCLYLPSLPAAFVPFCPLMNILQQQTLGMT